MPASRPSDIPVVAFSVGEEELAGIDTKNLVGHLAAWNYFQSVKNPTNDGLHQAVARLHQEPEARHQRPDGSALHRLQDVGAGGRSRPAPPTSTRCGRRCTARRCKAPSGFVAVMNTNHHLSKPVMIGEIQADGQFDVVWQTKDADQGRRLEPAICRGQGQDRRLDLSVGLRQLHRAEVQRTELTMPHRASSGGPGPDVDPRRTRAAAEPASRSAGAVSCSRARSAIACESG